MTTPVLDQNPRSTRPVRTSNVQGRPTHERGAEPMNTTPNSDASSSENLSEEERAAVRERAAESKSATRRSRTADKAAADERDVLTKIAEMPQPDRSLAERVHTLVTTAAPELSPKLWYGQPAYAKNGKVLCFFRSAQKDKARYFDPRLHRGGHPRRRHGPVADVVRPDRDEPGGGGEDQRTGRAGGGVRRALFPAGDHRLNSHSQHEAAKITLTEKRSGPHFSVAISEPPTSLRHGLESCGTSDR